MSDERRDPFNQIDPDINHYGAINNLGFPVCETEYFDIDKFNLKFQSNHRNLSIIHLNIRSINQNSDNFSVFLSNLNLKFDIICLSETWLTEGGALADFLPNHDAYHSCRRGNRRGGGVSIFIAKRLKSRCSLVYSENSERVECVFAEFNSNNRKVVIGSCYKPPCSNIELFNNEICNRLNEFNFSNTQFVLCGDFNVDYMKYGENNTISSFYNSLFALNMIPLITKPTRVIDSSCSLIDNILTSNPFNFISGVFQIDITDHFPIFAIFRDFFPSHREKNTQISFRLTSDARLEALKTKFNSMNLNAILPAIDISQDLDRLENKILQLYNTFCPVKHKILSYKDRLKPWISFDIRQSMKKRQIYFNLYRRGLLSANEYNKYRNLVNKQIRTAKQNYYINLFEKSKHDAKKSWKLINSLIRNSSAKSSNKIEKIVVDGVTLTVENDIASAFNQNFANIREKIATSIPCYNFDHLNFNFDHFS